MPKASATLTAKVDVEVEQLVRAAAASRGQSVSEWLRKLVEREVRRRRSASVVNRSREHDLATLESLARIRALLEFLIRGAGHSQILEERRAEIDGLTKRYVDDMIGRVETAQRRLDAQHDEG